MKQCLQYRKTYSDENLFCLSDGSSLVSDSFEQTTIIYQPAEKLPQGVNPILFYAALGLLVLIIVGGVAWVTTGNSTNQAKANLSEEQAKISEQKAKLLEQQMLLEKEKQQLADNRQDLNKNPSQVVQSATSPTTRVKFHRGNVEETLTGGIGSKRNFVLRTKNGQYLSASVNSNNGCVQFDNGTSNQTYTTTSGDNYLRLENTCGGQTNFSLTVYIR
jgi:hypothetical protein